MGRCLGPEARLAITAFALVLISPWVPRVLPAGNVSGPDSLMHRFPETVIAVICAADQGDTVRQSRRDYESVDDFPVYEAHVDSGGTLYWFGNAFEPPIEFRLHGVELWINGVRVPRTDMGREPCNDGLLRILRREPTQTELLHREAAGLAPFSEWVDRYRTSSLVDSVAVVGDSIGIQVRWADRPEMGFGGIAYRPPHIPGRRTQPPWIGLWGAVLQIKSHLEADADVWCHGLEMILPLPEAFQDRMDKLPSSMEKYINDPLPLVVPSEGR